MIGMAAAQEKSGLTVQYVTILHAPNRHALNRHAKT
jgi:hypothetical protein